MGEMTAPARGVETGLFPNVRRSPYFAFTLAEGATAFMVYNHMYMPIAYRNHARREYEALTAGVTLWDVGAERQTQLKGPDALELADFVCTRDLSDLAEGRCRYTTVCDQRGRVITEPIVLRPWADTVWISHGDVDLTLWVEGLATAASLEVEVSEPDVAPMQLQGPLSEEVMRRISAESHSLGYYRCMPAELAGVSCVISRTGWSGEHGYEIFPLSGEAAAQVWTAIREAGRDLGLLVTGPNLSRALEHAITDTHYFVNCDMNPFELGRDRLVDLEHGPFVGQEALRQARAGGVRRRMVGLLTEESVEGRLPILTEYWPVRATAGREDGGADGTDGAGGGWVGSVLWAAYAFALGRHAAMALLDAAVPYGARVDIDHSLGVTAATVTELPFV